jgi:hypothetical protein
VGEREEGSMKGFISRLSNSHKWVRIETLSEEAYRCRRCGKRHYGKLKDPDMTALMGGRGVSSN